MGEVFQLRRRGVRCGKRWAGAGDAPHRRSAPAAPGRLAAFPRLRGKGYKLERIQRGESSDPPA